MSEKDLQKIMDYYKHKPPKSVVKKINRYNVLCCMLNKSKDLEFHKEVIELGKICRELNIGLPIEHKNRYFYVRKKLHERIQELKTQIVNCKNRSYSHLEIERDKIAKLLWDVKQKTYSNKRDSWYRIAPSKTIKVFLGGRGG